MSEKIVVPTLGESVTEATVSKWLKNQGEKVMADEPVVELETDKVNVEVPSPSSGILENISVKEGETVNVGSLLGMINGSAKEVIKSTTETKNYSPPKKKTKILKEPEEEALTLSEEVENKPLKPKKEEALVLDNFHEEKKIMDNQKTKSQKPSLSPAARKIQTFHTRCFQCLFVFLMQTYMS